MTHHKTIALKHEDIANHFNTIASSGSTFPNYTKPVINLRDQKFFSSTCLAKLDNITKNFQKQVCELLAAHHMEVADRSKLLVTMRLRDISSIYDDSELRNRLIIYHETNLLKNTLHLFLRLTVAVGENVLVNSSISF